MRIIGLVLLTALAAAGVAFPPPEAPTPGSEMAIEEPPVAICAIQEGSGRTSEVNVLSTVNGAVALTLFASGATAGSIGHRTGPTGSVSIPVVDVAAVGTVGGLVEMPLVTSAAGVQVTGAESMSNEACAAHPDARAFLTGATTASGDVFELHLMNPYSGEAVAELTVHSEAGVESNERFESVIVPPRSSTILDFAELVPGRESLSITIETRRGRVITVGRQGVAGESAVWRAIAPAQDWFIPVPSSPGRREVVIATPGNSEVEYQLDFYSPTGLEEGLIGGVIPPRGQAVIDIAELTSETAAVRVVTTAPVVATLWLESEQGLSVTTASPAPANRWLLPNAGRPEEGTAVVFILNTAIDGSQVSVRALRPDSSALILNVEPDEVIELALLEADGYLVESVGETIVLWSARRGTSSTAAIGVPISDE